MRGFLGGAIWGLVVAGVSLSVASLIAPQPAGNRPPEAPQVEAPQEVPVAAPQEETDAAPAAAETAAPAGESPAMAEVTAPAAPAAEATMPAADRDPAEVPALGAAAEGLGAVPEVPEAAAVVIGAGGEAVQVPPGRAPAPVVPALEVDVAAATETALPQPVIVPEEVGDVEPVDEAVTQPVALVEAGGEMAADVGPVMAQEAPVARLPEADAAAPVQPEMAAEGMALPEIAAETAPVVPEMVQEIAPPVAEEVAVAEPVGVPEPEPEPEPEPQERRSLVLPQVGVEPEVAPPVEDSVAEATAAEELPGQNGAAVLPGDRSGIRVNRPAAGDAPAAETQSGGMALETYAAAWEGGSDLPRIGIVLLDAGALPGAVAAVAALPMPVTVAIDPGAAGAADLMAGYRAEGIEVLALARLPVGAMPVDVAVTYEAVFAILPEAVGVIDAGEGGLQAQSAVTEQAMARLAADGRGAVLPGGGLNMAVRMATEAGVPVAVIDLRLDAGGAEAAAIRRTLDQAAFRARQSGDVVLLGDVEAEVLSALMLWGAARAAAQVDVAPVSAILRGAGG
jgi:hypothetical protein